MRKISDLQDKESPPAGTMRAICIRAGMQQSKKKKTPYIELTWEDSESKFQWTDSVFCTVKAISRLAIVADRVCGFDSELPDDNNDAMGVMTDYVIENAIGKKALVTIEEKEEIYIPESGPDMGRKITIKRKRVAFGGYAKITAQETTQETTQKETKPVAELTKEEEDNLPF